MPIFGRNPSPEPRPTTPPARLHGLFSRRSRSTESDHTARTNATNDSVRTDSTRSGGGFFGRRRSSSSDDISHTSGSLLKDPSIVAARQKIADAESAERAADRALLDARAAVKAAREHAKMLEREALEECVFWFNLLPCIIDIVVQDPSSQGKTSRSQERQQQHERFGQARMNVNISPRSCHI